MEEVLAVLLGEEESLKNLMKKIQERRLEVSEVLADGQQELQQAFQRASSAVKKVESKWQDSEALSSTADHFPAVEEEISSIHRQLSMSLESGDMIETLSFPSFALRHLRQSFLLHAPTFLNGKEDVRSFLGI